MSSPASLRGGCVRDATGYWHSAHLVIHGAAESGIAGWRGPICVFPWAEGHARSSERGRGSCPERVAATLVGEIRKGFPDGAALSPFPRDPGEGHKKNPQSEGGLPGTCEDALTAWKKKEKQAAATTPAITTRWDW